MFSPASRIILGLGLTLSLAATTAVANGDDDRDSRPQSCAGLPGHHQLQTALEAARAQSNGGFDLDMWATVVNRDGVVCEVAFTGANRGSQWPGSRVISAQKANTANSFSLPGLGAVHRQSLCCSAARRHALWAAAQQPGRYGRGVPRARRPTSARTMTRCRAPDRGRECVRRRTRSLQLKGTAHRRDRCQRRHLLCRSQHRMADTAHVEPGFRPQRRECRRTTTISTT